MQYIVAVSPSDASQIYGFAQLTSGSSEPCIDVDPEKYPEPVELQRLYVGVEFAGKGVGKGLAREIERMAREMGRKTLWLGVCGITQPIVIRHTKSSSLCIMQRASHDA
ncbi:hypothetical protein M7I_1797 [Glarea lozoyensis 74030]|uniref:N-acetyltransferase domain-containing protein n=1 Tax=Glarea lozoyensis (strain ATCC 74030 / MF5533) TaxID=1104152 RepID=H0EH62_GLAL7|nr:hypothetical protein M7I_1797 [Glarea lozoyensis 74030]